VTLTYLYQSDLDNVNDSLLIFALTHGFKLTDQVSGDKVNIKDYDKLIYVSSRRDYSLDSFVRLKYEYRKIQLFFCSSRILW